ncbi:hypothetical protein PRIPAC_95127 [Pristionchus pacificus]|uniref:Uncharacterized protein n=1 Tax=Pristionchus pacificus TaxID=54126 RepID=A0A2A6BAU1_PRIPA|nr:hypothetical protein PRIPAC_95127 [Pristionchus pacificus]|eukprot:PDM62987.1 hypothetical protein PRIPAC_50202 [Pristionchus pacificus]
MSGESCRSLRPGLVVRFMQSRSPKNRTNLKEFGTAQKSRFSETMSFRVLEGADDDGDTHFFISTSPVISIEFYLGSQTRLILAVILTEGIWKNCFRRHAIWSQRDVDMKNDYAHRHPHPREPQTT